jgi:tRNA(Ile)-lysidine synthase
MSLSAEFARHLASLALGRERAIVAVSGGPDSVALLDLLVEARSTHALELTVAHVDHGIHPESGEVARRVREAAAELGLPFVCRALGLGALASETRARVARYAALEEMRAEADARWILTAHHADDQVETVLMRLLAGSGPAGLAGIAPRQGHLVRPLLPFRRSQLAQHVQQRNLRSWLDPANEDPRHLRSWLRTEILPALERRVPDVAPRLIRSAGAARADRDAWDAGIDAWAGLDWRTEPDGSSVAVAPLEVVDSKLACAIVMALARRCGFPLGDRRAHRVVQEVLRGASGAWVPLAQGWVAERSYDRLRVVRRLPVPDACVLSGEAGERVWGTWRIRWSRATTPDRTGRSGPTAWFVPAELAVRPARPGEKLRPLGGTGRRLAVRCFQDARVPRGLRGHWPVLEREGSIVWIPGVCRSDQLVPEPGSEALRVDAEQT